MKKGFSLRKINEVIEELCNDNIDTPNEYDETLERLLTPVGMSDEDLQVALDALTIERDDKIESIGYVLIEQAAKVEMLKRERERLAAWENRIRGRSKWLREYCLAEMIRAGISFVKAKFVRISTRTSPVSATYLENSDGEPDVHQLDPRFVKTEVKHKVDASGAIKHFKMMQKRYEETGVLPEEIPGFTFNDKNKHLAVK